MNISVIGTGYVGLVSGTCFAETGNQVICVDIDEKKIERLKKGDIPIYEPGLSTLFERNTKHHRLEFTTDLKAAIDHADIVFLALPTPPGEDGSADLSYILNAARDISFLINSYKIIVDKSTVPVGTAEKVKSVLKANLEEGLFDVVSNPEFLREGVAIDDFMKPDRIVIGADSEKAFEMMAQLYKPFVRQGNPIFRMDLRSAEMTKYAANSYLACRISFMNEIANLCELLGTNVDHVRKGMGSDSRIGKRFLFPGVGYGGSCFPKDVEALMKTAQEKDYQFKILEAVTQVNNRQKLRVYDKILNHFGGELKDKKIAIWGLSFKPNTDDIREAPAVYTINALLEKDIDVVVYDPEAMDNIRSIYGSKISYATDMYEALVGADALAIMTEWSVFRSPSFMVIRELLNNPVIIDGRNLYDPSDLEALDITYESIGRKTIKPKVAV